MQWDAGPGAGFTTGEPWLPLADDFREVNVEAERGDPGSMLSLYRRLIALRRAEPALHAGAWEPVDAPDGVLAYRRAGGGRRFLVALNLGGETRSLEMGRGTSGTVAVSTNPERDGEGVEWTLVLRGAEGVVVRLD